MKQKSKIITNSIYEKSINYCREKEYIKSILRASNKTKEVKGTL